MNGDDYVITNGRSFNSAEEAWKTFQGEAEQLRSVLREVIDSPESVIGSALYEKAQAVLRKGVPSGGGVGFVGHEWEFHSFQSDKCIHCGAISVSGMPSEKKMATEYCAARAAKMRCPACVTKAEAVRSTPPAACSTAASTTSSRR